MPATNRKLIDLTGQVFGRLTVISETTSRQYGNRWKRYWACECSCGKATIVGQADLKSGNTQSCGCYGNETRGKASIIHGMADSPEHTAWMRIIQRTENSNMPDQARYKGRGITMCRGWRQDFREFYRDTGSRPTPQHSPDRKDNNGGYWCGRCEECVTNDWPMNVRWATPKEQAQNRRSNHVITFNGETLVLAEWARRTGIDHRTILARLKLGWAIEQSLTIPVRPTQRKSN